MIIKPLGIALVTMGALLGLGIPLMAWLFEGGLDRDDLPFFKRVWLFCGAMAAVGALLLCA